MADAGKPDAAHPHDLLVRNVLADPDIAADFLRNYLPSEWASLLEWDSLKREGGETVAPNLSKLMGDLRYSARCRGGGEELKVFVFLEHQSRPERFMSFRMLGYVYAEYCQQFAGLKETRKRFPYPLAVVLHHGKTPWKRVPSMRDLIAIPPGVSGDVLHVPICLIDLAAMRPEQLRGHPMVCALLDSLQSASMGVLATRIREIFARLRGLDGDGRFKPWVTALGKYYTFVQKRIQGRFDDLAPAFMELFGKREANEMMMTIAESLQMEGLRKGKAEGKAEGLEQGRIESLITVLESRFDGIPAALQKKLRNVRGEERIEAMLKLAATCRSLKEFQKAL